MLFQKNIFLIALFLILLRPIGIMAQDKVVLEKIKVNGRAYDFYDASSAIYNLMVVNQRTQTGAFGSPDGTFSFSALRKDTILIGARDHSTLKICFADSAPKAEYNIIIKMQKIVRDLKEIEIFPEKDMQETYKEIEKLGYNEKDFMLSGIDAYKSPITFLYQKYNGRERSIRKYHELVNDDNRRMLLKELLRKYVEGSIIDLSNEEFDEFIDFCNVSDEHLKSTSQYDFVLYIKKRYAEYSKRKIMFGK